MSKLVEFTSNNYGIILFFTILFVLALIGYLRKFVFKSSTQLEEKIDFNELKTDLDEIEVTENKSLSEMLNQDKNI